MGKKKKIDLVINSEDQVLVEYFKRKDVQAQILGLVLQIREIFEFNSFTFIDYGTVFNKSTPEQLSDILNSLVLCNFLSREEERGIETFKLSETQFKTVIEDVR